MSRVTDEVPTQWTSPPTVMRSPGTAGRLNAISPNLTSTGSSPCSSGTRRARPRRPRCRPAAGTPAGACSGRSRHGRGGAGCTASSSCSRMGWLVRQGRDSSWEGALPLLAASPDRRRLPGCQANPCQRPRAQTDEYIAYASPRGPTRRFHHGTSPLGKVVPARLARSSCSFAVCPQLPLCCRLLAKTGSSLMGRLACQPRLPIQSEPVSWPRSHLKREWLRSFVLACAGVTGRK